jgi:hypothetical protein
MKLVKHTNVEEVIGVQQQHKFKITDGSQAIIMDSLINLYSDPIGSIVREITSNCIDANRERDLKLANKIPMEGTDDVSFWSTKQTVCIEYIEKNTILGIDECIIFHDSGCGLSQDRVANVFTTFGASTKRDNNFEIGGFGLGAKSPLAYTDTFYVSSRHNGTETYYMIYRNNDNVPHMDQVYQCNTDQQNGSTVIVPIKDSYDSRRFRDAINDQLSFFENLVFKNVEESIGSIHNYYTSKNDDYKVVEETDQYVLTNDAKSPFLLVGRVVYPINWDLLNIDESDYRASMGVKFDIGVLDLVPSREEIRYTPKTIGLIETLLKDLTKKFKIDIASQYQMTDYVEYMFAMANLGNHGSRWSSIASNDPKAIKASICNMSYYDVPFKLNPNLAPGNHNTNREFHQLFDGVSVYLCTLASNRSAIGGETLYHKELQDWSSFFDALKKVEMIYYVEGNFSKPKSYTILNDVDTNCFVAFKADKLKLGDRINDKSNLSDSRASYEKTATFNTVCRLLGKSPMVAKYADVEEAELDSELFGDIVDNKTRRKVNKMVFARNAEFKADGYQTDIKYTNQEYKISDLQLMLYPEVEDTEPTLKAVVYAETKDVDELAKVVKILGSSKDYYTNNYNYSYRFESDYRVVKVSKDVAKQFAKLDGFITAHEFMKSSTHLQRFATAQRISKFIKTFSFLSYYDDYDKDLHKLYRALYEYHKNNTHGCWRCETDIKPIMEEIMKLDISDDVRFDMELIDKLEEVVEYSQGLNLLNYVSFGSDARNSVEDFLSLKDKLPNNQSIKLTLTAKNQKSNELLSS